MTKAIDRSKDGADPLPWRDYAPHLTLLALTAGLVTMRAVGVIDWPWWAVLVPTWLLITLYVASIVAAITHRTEGR